ncbi:hypothetical protein KM043_005443 [Ampulex compressa]|nr:hypothetical protein KM043_005443 [Ampulex compressa]
MPDNLLSPATRAVLRWENRKSKKKGRKERAKRRTDRAKINVVREQAAYSDFFRVALPADSSCSYSPTGWDPMAVRYAGLPSAQASRTSPPGIINPRTAANSRPDIVATGRDRG